MPSSIERPAIIAISQITNDLSHIADKKDIFSTTLTALAGSGDDLIESTVINTQRGHVTTLGNKQEAMKTGPSDRKEQRDMSFYVCRTDYINNMALVQIAASNIADPVEAKALIIRNGYGVQEPTSHGGIPDIKLSNKKNTPGTVVAQSKVPDTKKKYAIEWQYSIDNGTTWVPWYPTAVNKVEITGIASGAKMIGRRRFIISYNTPEEWISSHPLTVA